MPPKAVTRPSVLPPGFPKGQIRTVTRTPLGKCPISLRGYSSIKDLPSVAGIIEWFWAIRNWGIENGIYYTADAISYWARTEFDPAGEFGEFEYEEIQRTILSYAATIKDWSEPVTED